MNKKYYRRVEGPHNVDGYWQRHNSQHDDDKIIKLDIQDNGDTLKLFKEDAMFIKVELLNGAKCFLRGQEIENPIYFAPYDVHVGMKVWVPIGGKHFFEARVTEVNLPAPDFMVRAIDCKEGM